MSTRQWLGTTSTAFATAANWVQASTPVNTDEVYFDENSAGTGGCAGSDQSAITLDSFTVKMTNPYAVGTNGTPLKIGSTLWDIGLPSQSATTAGGSGRINLDGHTVASTWYLRNTAQASTDTGKEPGRIKATNAANIAYISGGRWGIATDAIGDTAQFATINVTGSPIVTLGEGLTLATLNIDGGDTTVKNTVTTVSHRAGNITTMGDYTITTFSASAAGAVINHRKTAGNSITTLNLYAGAVVDLSGNAGAIAIGTINVYGDATIIRNAANPTHLSWTTLTFVDGDLHLTAA